MTPRFLVSTMLLLMKHSMATVHPDQLYEMIDEIIEQNFQNTCIIVVSDGGFVTNRLIPAIYLTPYQNDTDSRENLAVEMDYKELSLTAVLEIGCKGYIIQVKNPEKQLQLIEETFILITQRNRRKFIILPSVTMVPSPKERFHVSWVLEKLNYQSILKGKSASVIPDIIFTVPDENNAIHLRTHRFTGIGEACSDDIHLDTYNVDEKTFRHGVDLFPDKVKDLQGKALKLALFHYTPYVVYSYDNSQNETLIDGTEWRVAVEYAKLHNCSLELVDSSEGLWGEIYDNRTGSGLLGKLAMDEADIGMTALYTWYSAYLYLDFSSTFIRTGITSLVPLPAQLPQWMSPILPFTRVVWMTMIGMTIVSIIFTDIVNYIASKIYSNDDSIRFTLSESALAVAGITLQQGLPNDPQVASWSALSMALLVVSVLTTTAYGSGLSSALTIPRYYEPINTPEDLAKSNTLWTGTSDAWTITIDDAEEPELITVVKNFRRFNDTELAEKSFEGKWGFAMERFPGYYGIQDYLSSEAVENMHLMTHDIYWTYCVFMFRKSSPYTESYSKRVLEILQSGISTYWMGDVFALYLNPRTQLVVRTEHASDGGPVKLAAGHVQGIFYVLLIGSLLSACVFLGEIYFHK